MKHAGELGIGEAHASIENVASLRGFWFVAAPQIENRAFVNTTRTCFTSNRDDPIRMVCLMEANGQ